MDGVLSRSSWSFFFGLGLIAVASVALVESAFGAQTLIPATSSWRYKADGSDQGSAWSAPGFNVTSWPTGMAPLGFGDPHIVTALQSGFITYYFRRDFIVTNASAISGLALRLLRDDGAVVYLNGTEVRRDNMPAGPVTYTTLAPVAVGGPDETTYFESAVPTSLLVNGANVLAVEVHQNSAISSDLGFDAALLANSANTPPVALDQSVAINKNETLWITLYGTDAENNTLTYSIVTAPSHGQLTGTPPQVFFTPATNYVGSDSFTFKVNDGQADSAPATVSIQVLDPLPAGLLIRRGDLWKYLDTGVDPGGAWISPGYNDSAWPASNAEFGYGDGDEVTVINNTDASGGRLITAYFRRSFTVTNALSISGLSLQLWRDDGAIVYLNGAEVLRNNMPPGPATYSTLASALAPDDGEEAVAASISGSLLVNGANVIAVEVHQVNATSSDLTFDLELSLGSTPTNHAPVANNLSVTVQANIPTPITLTGSDADGDPLTFSIVTFPIRGTLSGSVPNLTYTPNPGYSGPDSFEFRVNDGSLSSATATVSIEVQAVSTALVPRGSVWKYLDAGADPGTAWIDPLYNDSTWSAGPAELGFGDGDEATVINSAPGGNRLITAYFRKRFTVANASGISGLSLQLWRDDGAIVYLNGTEVLRNNMPTGPVFYSTLGAVAGDDGESPVMASLSGDLLVTGENLFAVEVHQSSPTSSDLSFDLELAASGTPPNNPPVANNQSVAVQEDTPTVITLSASDADDDPLTYVIYPASHGNLSGTPPNITYAPNTGYIGPDSFNFSVNDGKIDSAIATVSIQVQAAPNALIPAGSVWRYLDTGADPGTAWISPSYNDSAWRLGPAELGFGDGDEATVIRSTNVTGRLITAYFRRTFNVSNPSTIGNLSLQLWRDDGAVVYLNGVEVLRNNMPAGSITYSTLALSAAPDDGNGAVTAEIRSSLLVSGANLLAVEVHQNAPSSSDLSFDLQLDSSSAPPNQPPTANNQSVTTFQNTAVAITLTGSDLDGDSLAYTVMGLPTHGTLSGTPPNVIYTPAMDYIGPDSFTFTVSDGQARSGPATVNIQVLRTPDPPEVVSAVVECSSRNVLVTFNEAVDRATAENPFNYHLEAPSGTIIPALQVVLGPSAQDVLLRFDPPPSPGQNYTLVVNNLCDPSGDCAQNQRVPVQFETEPPVVACNVAVNPLSPPNNQLINVGLTASSSDGNLGVQVFSDEPELSVLDDAVLTNGALKLRARRNPSQDGRVYLIVITSTDGCGNIGVCCKTVVVPVNGSQSALDAVNAQAAAAQSECSPNGAPSTPYRLRLPVAASSATASAAQQGTERLLGSVLSANVGRNAERVLCAALNAAADSFAAGRDGRALDQLRAFQNKVRAQLGRTQPDLVEALIQGAQDIIDGGW
ncbi:MAG TPA: Ig-like domain-containing protein [Verrucomicrobiae bacterium]|nr:Ig-like domain-containing protein [Verrucomicrobiae bacterium]